MGTSHRYMTSLLMTAIYLLMVLSPLASPVMKSIFVEHTVYGQCSGDCRVDECSLERSSAHTCCCWQKKQSTHIINNSNLIDTDPAQTDSLKNGSSCCVLTTQDKYSLIDILSESPAEQERITTISSRTCGSGKLFELLTIESTQYLPSFFAENINSSQQSILTFVTPVRLMSRYGEPPDPPPIIPFKLS